MVDPVCTVDGNVFERRAIASWLEMHPTNPITGDPLTSDALVPNLPLARLIRGALPLPPSTFTYSTPSPLACSSCTTPSPTTFNIPPAVRDAFALSVPGEMGLLDEEESRTPLGVDKPDGVDGQVEFAIPDAQAVTPSSVGEAGFASVGEGGVGTVAPPQLDSGMSRREMLELWRQRRGGSVGDRSSGGVPPSSVGVSSPPVEVCLPRSGRTDPVEAARIALAEVATREVQGMAEWRTEGRAEGRAEEVRELKRRAERGREAKVNKGIDVKANGKRNAKLVGKTSTNAEATAGRRLEGRKDAKDVKASCEAARMADSQPDARTHGCPQQARDRAGTHRFASSAALAPKPTSRANIPTSREKGVSKEKEEEEMALLQLLRSHNAKFATKPTFEPRTRSVAQVREWENRTGQQYAKLSYDERLAANQEITAWLREHSIDG